MTLHVGRGTLRPVQVDDPRAHRLDAEDYDVPVASAVVLNRVLAAYSKAVAAGFHFYSYGGAMLVV